MSSSAGGSGGGGGGDGSQPLALLFDRHEESVHLFGAGVASSLTYADSSALRAAARRPPSAGMRVWRPVVEGDVTDHVSTCEDDANLLIPVHTHRHAATGAGTAAPSILSSSAPPTVEPLHSALLSELVRWKRSPAWPLGSAATAQVKAVENLRRGMKRGAARDKSRAGQVHKWIREAMEAYEGEEALEEAEAEAAASAQPASLSSAAASLREAVRNRGNVAAMKVQVEAAQSAVSAIMHSAGSGSSKRPSSSLKSAPQQQPQQPLLQRLALQSLVSTGLIFLNALQQHDPIVLQQILQLTRDSQKHTLNARTGMHACTQHRELQF